MICRRISVPIAALLLVSAFPVAAAPRASPPAGMTSLQPPGTRPPQTDTSPEILFDLLLGGRGFHVGNSLIERAGGGYVVAGYTDATDGQGLDGWLLWIEPDGTVVRERRYGGPGDDFAWDLREHDDGSLTVVGFTGSTPGGDEDIWLFRTDATGTLLWERRFGGPADEEAWTLELTEEGDAILLAQTESVGAGREDVLLLRVNAEGDRLWQTLIGDTDTDRAFAMSRLGDGFAVAGMTREPGREDLDVLVAVVDPDGRVTWRRSYGGSADDIGHGILTSATNTLLVTGYSRSFGDGSNDLLLLELDADGRPLQRHTHGGAGDERGMMGTSTPDGVLAIGYSGEADWDVSLWHVDRQGDVTFQWRRPRPGLDRGVLVRRLADGSYAMTGQLRDTEDQPGGLFVTRFRLPDSEDARS